MDYFVDREFIADRYNRIVSSTTSSAKHSAAVASGEIGVLVLEYFDRYMPWTLLVILLYYPLVLYLDATRDRAKASERRARNPWLVHVWALWNLALSLLSVYGAVIVDGVMLRTAVKAYSNGDAWFCELTSYDQSYVAYVLVAFVVSKYAELMDTVFLLLLSGQPIVFLHSFHHVCTLAYVVYASVHHETLTGHTNALFGGMNLLVHSFMYMYYALQISPLTAGSLKDFLRRVSPLITTLQLAQMILGLYFCVYSGLMCKNSMARVSIPALIMYAIYFREFYLLLMTRDKSKPKSSPTNTPPTTPPTPHKQINNNNNDKNNNNKNNSSTSSLTEKKKNI